MHVALFLPRLAGMRGRADVTSSGCVVASQAPIHMQVVCAANAAAVLCMYALHPAAAAAAGVMVDGASCSRLAIPPSVPPQLPLPHVRHCGARAAAPHSRACGHHPVEGVCVQC